jgi:hypothetical protein
MGLVASLLRGVLLLTVGCGLLRLPVQRNWNASSGLGTGKSWSTAVSAASSRADYVWTSSNLIGGWRRSKPWYCTMVRNASGGGRSSAVDLRIMRWGRKFLYIVQQQREATRQWRARLHVCMCCRKREAVGPWVRSSALAMTSAFAQKLPSVGEGR